MLTFRRILYLTNFSDSAAGALPYAVAMARPNDATVTCLTVLARDADDRSARSRLDEIAATIAAEGITAAVAVRRADAVAEDILAFSEQGEFDLIVTATRGRTGLDRLLVGSTTEKVVERSRIPVLTVRTPEHADGTIRRLLFPTYLWLRANPALREAAAFATGFDAELHLLHVVGRESQTPDVDTSSPEAVEAFLRRQLANLAEQDGLTLPKQVTFAVRTGRPHEEITAYAAATRMDLIVMSTHGHTAPEDDLIGSMTERVVRTAPCPVLSLHE